MKNVVELWYSLWEIREKHRNCPNCQKRSRKKVKGKDGKTRYPIYVCAKEFDVIINALTNHYYRKACKLLKKLLSRFEIAGYDADVLANQRFFFALLRYHPSFYPDNPEGGFYPFVSHMSMLFFDARDYKKKNISPITFSPVNDLLEELEGSGPNLDIN